MDEIDKCLEVLGLKPGATQDDVQQAYRELAMVWHPDRFAADSPLQAKADAKSKEINAAYEFLLAHGFKDGVAVSYEGANSGPQTSPLAAETTVEEDTAEPSAGSNKVIWTLATLMVAAIAIWFWYQHKIKISQLEPIQGVASGALTRLPEVATNLSPPAPVDETPAKIVTANLSTNDFLSTLLLGGKSTVNLTSEGTTITGGGWLHTREEYSPPFVIHAVAKTDLTNIRLMYGKGIVIFNWELNPGELRFHDPASGQTTAVPGQGHVPVNEWQDIEWRVETNFSTVSVNGTERARIFGSYSGLSELAGIRTALGATITIRQFEVRKLGPGIPPRSLSPGAGLVLYFPFETDENGMVSDQSGFKNNGTVRGAKFTREGKVGGAMSFDGKANPGDSILVRNSPSLVSMQRTRQLTICAWIKPNSLPSEYPVILAKGGNYRPKAYGGYELALRAAGENGLNFFSGKYGLVCFYDGESWFPKHLHEWIHIATVINTVAGTGKLYINGERMDDQAFDNNSREANFALINDLIIGGPDSNHDPNSASFDGLIDELRIYSRALTTEEIRNLPGFNQSSP